MENSILKDSALDLPIRDNSCGCERAIDAALDKYCYTLESYSCDDEIIERVVVFRDYMRRVFASYYLGDQNKAFVLFGNAIKKLMDGHELITTTLPRVPFYRARINENNEDYSNDEMFHIPFELRGKVSTQRFSAPGTPCLYLGCSSYICWLELNRPSLDQFQVAMIRQNSESEDVRVIDLCIPHQQFIPDDNVSLERYLLWWPVMAVCSIAVRNESDVFKPEYICPQFILQLLVKRYNDQKIYGIKYMSIKAGKASEKQYNGSDRLFANYVIPIREINESGFCPILKKMFSVVRNYSGRELQILTDTIRQTGVTWGTYPERHDNVDEIIYGTNDTEFLYKKSVFARIEQILNNESVNQFNDDGKFVIKPISNDEIDKLFHVEGETLIIGDSKTATSRKRK